MPQHGLNSTVLLEGANRLRRSESTMLSHQFPDNMVVIAIVLQSLISLEVLCIAPRPVSDVLRFFSALLLPNLRSFVWHYRYAKYKEDFTTLLESLACQ